MEEGRLPGVIEPEHWFVAFYTKASNRWLSFLSFGRFKHVSAYAYYPGFKVWLVCSSQLEGLRITMVGHNQPGHAALLNYIKDCHVVRFKKSDRPIGIAPHLRLGFYCVPAIKHLLGVRCPAFTPDALYRHLMQNGGTLVGSPEITARSRTEGGGSSSAERA